MRYNEYEVAFSPARLSRYKAACGGDTRKAMTLYRYNVRLCQKFYAVLSVFEIILRNAIDRHFRAYYNDPNWIEHQLQTGGMLAYSPKKAETMNCRTLSCFATALPIMSPFVLTCWGTETCLICSRITIRFLNISLSWVILISGSCVGMMCKPKN